MNDLEVRGRNEIEELTRDLLGKHLLMFHFSVFQLIDIKVSRPDVKEQLSGHVYTGAGEILPLERVPYKVRFFSHSEKEGLSNDLIKSKMGSGEYLDSDGSKADLGKIVIANVSPGAMIIRGTFSREGGKSSANSPDGNIFLRFDSKESAERLIDLFSEEKDTKNLETNRLLLNTAVELVLEFIDKKNYSKMVSDKTLPGIEVLKT